MSGSESNKKSLDPDPQPYSKLKWFWYLSVWFGGVVSEVHGAHALVVAPVPPRQIILTISLTKSVLEK
jgi:hypothetical protein